MASLSSLHMKKSAKHCQIAIQIFDRIFVRESCSELQVGETPNFQVESEEGTKIMASKLPKWNRTTI